MEGPILIIGGTRGTGRLIALRLLDDGLRVRVLARNPAAARERLDDRCEIVRGDLTDAPSLPPALADARHVIFTAGCRSGHPVRSTTVRKTEYQGVVNSLAAAEAAAFNGRFLYMTSSGVGQRSFWTFSLNLYQGNTLHWRWRAEAAILASKIPYTIIRTGVLLNAQSRPHAIMVTQQALPLSPRHRIARADVAEVFRAALDEPAAIRATFEIAWQPTPRVAWREALTMLASNPS